MKKAIALAIVMAASGLVASDSVAGVTNVYQSVPATASVNVNGAYTSFTLSILHGSIDCGQFVPTAALPTAVGTYAAGSACPAVAASSTWWAQLTQTGTTNANFYVTVADGAGGSSASSLGGAMVTLSNTTAVPAGKQILLDLGLKIGASFITPGTYYTPSAGESSTQIRIVPSLQHAIDNTWTSGVFGGTVDVTVSL